MTGTTAELPPQVSDAMTIQELTKEVLFMKKQYNTMYNTVQSLSSQVMRLDRDVAPCPRRRTSIEG